MFGRTDRNPITESAIKTQPHRFYVIVSEENFIQQSDILLIFKVKGWGSLS